MVVIPSIYELIIDFMTKELDERNLKMYRIEDGKYLIMNSFWDTVAKMELTFLPTALNANFFVMGNAGRLESGGNGYNVPWTNGAELRRFRDGFIEMLDSRVSRD